MAQLVSWHGLSWVQFRRFQDQRYTRLLGSQTSNICVTTNALACGMTFLQLGQPGTLVFLGEARKIVNDAWEEYVAKK